MSSHAVAYLLMPKCYLQDTAYVCFIGRSDGNASAKLLCNHVCKEARNNVW